MKITLAAFVLLALAASPWIAESPGDVVRLDPAMDVIAPAGARVEKVAGGFGFTEGPIWSHAGYLLFSDCPNNKIMKYAGAGAATVFLAPSADSPQGAGFSPNGLTLDAEGRLTVCDYGNRRVARLEKDAKITTLADRFEGKRLSSPNDLIYRSDGSLYFTDPPYGLPKQDDDPGRELPFNGVYRVFRAGGAWKLELLVKDLTRPNGIALSPDEKYLYVDNSEPKKLLMRYEVRPDGSLGPGKLLADVTAEKEDGLPDGMKVDRKGFIYMTGPGGVLVFSPAGKHVGTIKPPEVPANCHWGDADGKTLYMTARTGLYRIRLGIPGVRP